VVAVPTKTKHILNSEAIEQSVWLVKVPNFVAEKWSTAQNDDIVGNLTISLKPPSNPGELPAKQLKVTLTSQPMDDHDHCPKSYILDELKSSTDTIVAFSTERDGNGFTIDGKVTKNMVLKPEINDEYRQLIRERALLNVMNKKEIGLANMKEIERTATQSHTVEFITSDKVEMKRKAAAERAMQSSKRAALSGGLIEASEELENRLRSKLLEAFAQNERLTFKDIVTACSGVPGFSRDKDLRDVLEMYGKYNTRGLYKHYWELKPEYKDHFAVQPNS
jgi:hypothetical protein